MSRPRHISVGGLAQIVRREGVRLTAYPDPATHGPPWTIGVGHTGPDVHPGLRISLARAHQLARGDLAPIEKKLFELGVPEKRMFDSLCSIFFNMGLGYAEPAHTIGAALHRRDWEAVGASIMLYDVPAMIIGRRREERDQYMRGLRAYRRVHPRPR